MIENALSQMLVFAIDKTVMIVGANLLLILGITLFFGIYFCSIFLLMKLRARD